jgi:hypothetical protein
MSESNRKHCIIKRGDLNDLDGDDTRAIYTFYYLYSHHTSEESLAFEELSILRAFCETTQAPV